MTGQLGDVMKESINTSLSWIKTNAFRLGLSGNSEVVSVLASDSDLQKSKQKH